MRTQDLYELQDAIAAARIAGEYIRREYESFTPIPDAPANISTAIDHGSQELIFNYLAKRYPQDGLCGEESSGPKSDGTSNRVWVVDPIDGTRGFARKNGEFSVMIGLTMNREPVLGVVLEPVTMTVTYAAKHQGCWIQRGDGEAKRCQVRDVSHLPEAILVQSHTKPGRPSSPATLLKPGSIRETYSAGLKMAMVARGEADVYVINYGSFNDWDICAGHVLVTEAGGVVTDVRGSAIAYGRENFKQKNGLVACNQRLHQATIQILQNMEWL